MIRACFHGSSMNFGHLLIPPRHPPRRHEKSPFASFEDLLAAQREATECNTSRLPPDLWVEILCRVPTEEIIRSKVVCKLWKYLIESFCVPKLFASAFFTGFIFKVIDGKYEPSLDYKVGKGYHLLPLGPVATCSALLPFAPSSSDFLGYCNGLQLFIQTSTQQYYVCNYRTRQCVAIPTCSHVQNFRFSSLIFDPCESLHFKLVCFEGVSPCIKYYIFSSETCRWDIHEVVFEHPASRHDWRVQSVYSNGVLYHLSESKHLICFDINQLNVCAIDLPEKETTNAFGHAGEHGELYYSSYSDSDIYIWMLKGYSDGGSWILVKKISVGGLDSEDHWYWDFPQSPNYIHHPVSSRLNLIVTGTPKVVAICDLSRKRVRLHWWMRKEDDMALGECMFWLHRYYLGSICLKNNACACLE